MDTGLGHCRGTLLSLEQPGIATISAYTSTPPTPCTDISILLQLPSFVSSKKHYRLQSHWQPLLLPCQKSCRHMNQLYNLLEPKYPRSWERSNSTQKQGHGQNCEYCQQRVPHMNTSTTLTTVATTRILAPITYRYSLPVRGHNSSQKGKVKVDIDAGLSSVSLIHEVGSICSYGIFEGPARVYSRK